MCQRSSQTSVKSNSNRKLRQYSSSEIENQLGGQYRDEGSRPKRQFISLDLKLNGSIEEGSYESSQYQDLLPKGIYKCK